MPLGMSTVSQALAGRYAVERTLGHGGMATVFLAHDLHGARQVAIKVLRPELAATVAAERFHREVRILAGLHHANIVPMLESGESEMLVYLVTPYVAGGSLRTLLAREPQLRLNRALAIARDVAAGLDYVHGHGMVHRDIKPENILFDGERALLCDFGIARAVVAAAGEQISSSGIILGTPGYMSPEQAAGQSNLDHRSDIYSLACVIYEMLAGEPPFTGRSKQAVMARQISEKAPSLGSVRPDVPPRVDAAIEVALAKHPGARPATAAQLARLLLEGGVA